MGPRGRVTGVVIVALVGALALGGCSGEPAGAKPVVPAPASASSTAPSAPSPSEPASAQPSTPAAEPRPSATGGPEPERTPAGASDVPQNPNRGPNPPPAPDRPPLPTWKPAPFDPKDPSVPNYTVPPPMR
ncbi:hypothetical protein [Streptomyces erythrochromogenes]|uniref:hypothetical protein n=1 Tax=Streptomyces erythrochromogenes TaxID=285574 RepID=UPI00131CC68D|nr:hypothetical protein [Streptomyces erythrochromogenes]